MILVIMWKGQEEDLDTYTYSFACRNPIRKYLQDSTHVWTTITGFICW